MDRNSYAKKELIFQYFRMMFISKNVFEITAVRDYRDKKG